MSVDMLGEIVDRCPDTRVIVDRAAVVVVVVHRLIVVSLEGEGAKATLTHLRQVYKPSPLADSGAAYRSIGDTIQAL